MMIVPQAPSTVDNNIMASTRNKYNTLTPGEAKKLSKFLTNRQPTRTASVLHKPRPPPMVVTDLDSMGTHATNQARTSNTFSTTLVNSNGLPKALSNQNSAAHATTGRSSSSCSNHSSYRGHRHSMNLGHNYAANNQRYATLNAFTKYNYGMSDSSNKSSTLKSSPDDSESNLSFRSSLDIVDSAYGSDRIQTMSVDLGNPIQNYNYKISNNKNCSKYPSQNNSANLAHEYSNKISDESFSSARSHQSESTQMKSSPSKLSLSTSTSRVFQNQLCNLKKFFRYMPIKRSYVNNEANGNQKQQSSTSSQCDIYVKSSTKQPMSLEESLSQLFLNRSQSPPVCPPPPGELKSMSYMENSVNYSNYDEFTRDRNKQTTLMLNKNNRTSSPQQNYAEPNNLTRGCSNGLSTGECEDPDAWQLTSLPVSYERNLTTVFEERPNPINAANKNPRIQESNKSTTFSTYKIKDKHLIEPPENFDDKIIKSRASDQTISHGSSSQSLTSITTADSILEFHRQTGTSFRFSYARPSSFDRAPSNQGLPPRMPIYEQSKQGTSTGGSSSNSSLTNNGTDNSDSQLQPRMSQQINKPHYGFKTTSDADTTLTSDTSTLHGDDLEPSILKKKCADLEQEVTNLGNKLSTKDKELRELQLKLWSSDYLIDQLKANISRLEKENAQLKAVVISSGGSRVYL